MEKASFDRLNKLYKISVLEQDHQTLLSAQNLLEVVRESCPYMIPVVPRKLPSRIVVPGEHYALKDLPFYKEAREADAKARQERLEQREEKRQEGTLRKALGKRGQPSSSSVCPPAKKKKKPSARVVEVPDSIPAQPSASAPTPFIHMSPDNSAPDLGGESIFPEFDLGPPRSEANPSTSESDPVTVGAINEPEVEDMTSDLTTGFRRRMHKRLHEPIN